MFATLQNIFALKFRKRNLQRFTGLDCIGFCLSPLADVSCNPWTENIVDRTHSIQIWAIQRSNDMIACGRASIFRSIIESFAQSPTRDAEENCKSNRFGKSSQKNTWRDTARNLEGRAISLISVLSFVVREGYRRCRRDRRLFSAKVRRFKKTRLD